MDTENALIQHLYINIAEAMQVWRKYKDIYGIWFYVDSDQTNLAGISYLRQSLQTPEGLRAWGGALRDAYFAELKQQPGYVPWEQAERPLQFSDFPEKLAFIRVCGEVIKQLHENGGIADVCGKPVPVGITYYHDSDGEMVRFAALVAAESNPPGLTDEMLSYQIRAGI